MPGIASVVRARTGILLASLLFGCADVRPPVEPDAPVFDAAGQEQPGGASVLEAPGAGGIGAIPLNDMVTLYKGFAGHLYAGGNTPPLDHATAGLSAARSIRPLNGSGQAAVNGKYVLLSIGMSNTTEEWCSTTSDPPCTSWSFTGQAKADPTVNHTTLAIVNGARPGGTTGRWDSPADPDYDRVRNERLAPRGLTEKQVQIVWMKVVNYGPTVAMPATNSDANNLVAMHGAILRVLKRRYPNLRQAFLSSRIYGGYTTHVANPEPYAFEGGFAVKWTIEAQIRQMRTGQADWRAGDLRHPSVAPWIAWGPYLWANGVNPRSDGLAWRRSDIENDGIHPTQSGEAKVGSMLLTFFKTSPHTSCWFLAGRTC
jgi:hypothetical protein